MSTVVIVGFAGVGKTKATEALVASGHNVIDSDSSSFPKEGFPGNYIENIKSIIAEGSCKVLFVSAHKEVREALRNAGITYLVVYPNVGLKKEYLRRYEVRGSSPEFIKLLSDNWENWIAELHTEGKASRIAMIELEHSSETMLEVANELKLV